MKSLFLLLACLLALAGCITEGNTRHAAVVSPWSEKDAPAVMLALAEDITAYRATTGKMPDALADLDRAGISSDGPYGERGFAYSPAGIGMLREGWMVVAADDRVRSAGTVWCVLRPPSMLRTAAGLRVAQVPMPELRAAAAGPAVAP